MVWPPAPVSIRYTPLAVRVHYAPIDLREPRSSLPGSSKRSTGNPVSWLGPTPENIPLPAVTKDELITLDTTLDGSAPVDAALALSTGIDAKNRCISVVRVLRDIPPPNLAKYPPEDRMRVRGREVRLAAKLQDKRRRQDAKEGKNEPKPSMRADFEVWMEMMKHGCIPGDKERPENWSLRSIARWKTRDGGRNGKRQR
ncbi:hypothetical protein RhiXN_07965 [Rhizoctonia solani]|uniref:Uncharacterized protein n=1 Tax=Rhizoctonia solani TaxID=456999 RepID=A0A8H8SYZ4_9AGAM|nr:uncharacterized protein RhiXN_07965 [Rhizoctonia solani]QRW22929.1 hypothetical protein RhiXN_07965 [Rhizoctonia solani]